MSYQNNDEDDLDPDEPDNYCTACAGTGEGQYDGASCSSCGGAGYHKAKADPDDFVEPDDDFEPWDGPD